MRPSTSEKNKETHTENPYNSKSLRKKLKKSKLDQAPSNHQVWAQCNLPFPRRSPDKQTHRELRIIIPMHVFVWCRFRIICFLSKYHISIAFIFSPSANYNHGSRASVQSIRWSFQWMSISCWTVWIHCHQCTCTNSGKLIVFNS